ncbi:hypothetical protein CEXT_237841 [Caerostris extrusa]|uniref:Uncharacterized protein n=1 Tax=Caerostris extrusa TaxID=172846 RepID=A0AAV4RBJ8_CAEEX|nr:hypothetical protein CEXT_237841 [Caerostris extrusa]
MRQRDICTFDRCQIRCLKSRKRNKTLLNVFRRLERSNIQSRQTSSLGETSSAQLCYGCDSSSHVFAASILFDTMISLQSVFFRLDFPFVFCWKKVNFNFRLVSACGRNNALDSLGNAKQYTQISPTTITPFFFFYFSQLVWLHDHSCAELEHWVVVVLGILISFYSYLSIVVINKF